MDALEAVLDEVALEGLDGVTVPALWLRLQARVPPFPLILDAATKQLLWQSLLRNEELDFCELPEERPPLVICNRSGLLLITQCNLYYLFILIDPISIHTGSLEPLAGVFLLSVSHWGDFCSLPVLEKRHKRNSRGILSYNCLHWMIPTHL